MKPPTESQAPFQRSRRILLTDDDRLNLRILGGILKPQGYVVEVADSGESALEIYPKFKPDLVLLDVVMPGIDGLETCRILKQRYGEEDCAPVIFITAMNESDDVVAGFAAGGVDYLRKPFEPKEVVARIRTHLQNQWLNEQQKNLVHRLNQADASKNRFLGMAAHDLRNPLASVRGLTEFLIDGTVGMLTAEQLDLVNTIHDASQSMLDLVNELLDVATIESGELKLRRQPCDLSALIGKCTSLRNIDAAKKRTRIVPVLPASGPMVDVDSARIQQVVDNLLSNAVKYSPPGSVVTIELASGAGVYGFSVKDQGPGIPEGERDRLFKDFGRLSVLPTGGEKSTGLGLAICRKIVEAHGGTVVAENLPGLGCEFRVTLPSTP